MAQALIACKFRVHGKVQKVFFRKYTQEMAQQLGLRGWVMNTPEGTVVGELEGPPDKVAEMKQWLTSKGSPKSVIENAEFTDERSISECSHSKFDLKR